MEWIINDDYIIGKYNFKKKSRAVGFDLDHTLIKPLRGRFSKSSDDWKFYFDNIKTKLNKLYKKHYEIIIITNQSGLKNENKLNIWKKKIELFSKKLNIPFMILASFGDNKYRKPKIGFNEIINGKLKFFCGDAGGYKTDFSDTDHKFALNLNINFYHRDTFFKKIKRECTINYVSLNISKNKYKFNLSEEQELIINVGYPGSGKSFYTKHYIIPNKYKCINQDKLKTFRKCIKKTQEYLDKKFSVVVDNTNPSREIRKQYIDIAKLKNISVRCLYFTTSMELSRHNNYYRNYIDNTKIVPLIAYRIYSKKFNEPHIDEGFSHIEKINFSLKKKLIDFDIYNKYYY